MSRARSVASVLLTALVLALALGAVTDVRAPSADPDRTDCGSLPQILRTGTGYHGGELRSDEDAFDAACVRAAHRRGGLLAAGAVVAAGLAGSLHTSRRRRVPGVGPPPRLR